MVRWQQSAVGGQEYAFADATILVDMMRCMLVYRVVCYIGRLELTACAGIFDRNGYEQNKNMRSNVFTPTLWLQNALISPLCMRIGNTDMFSVELARAFLRSEVSVFRFPLC